LMLKNELRIIYLSKLKSLSAAERLEKSEQISRQFFAYFTLENVRNLHIFLSIKKNNEVETRFIYEQIWRDFSHIRTFVPRVHKEILEHLEFTKETKLIENSWKILEPIDGELFDEKLFDIVFVPLLCVDMQGNRVGYGNGFYDKFLINCRKDCVKIGVSFFEPIAEITDKNKFDVKLDYCLTPNRLINF
jgi:5-formyltetrahydrofolate cyclo-ligase